MEQLYYRVSGRTPCGISNRYTTVVPARDEEDAIVVLVKSKAYIEYITEVKQVPKDEYEAQENFKKRELNRKENELRWNKILKQYKNAN